MFMPAYMFLISWSVLYQFCSCNTAFFFFIQFVLFALVYLLVGAYLTEIMKVIYLIGISDLLVQFSLP